MTESLDAAEAATAQRVAADPARFFDRFGGLLVQTLADEIRRRVDLGRLKMNRDVDANDALWYCKEGLWRPGGVTQIERACNDLLGERLRTSYVTNVTLALRASDLPSIDDGPPHPHLINFANGVLDWSTLGFARENPADKNQPKAHDVACAWNSTVRLAVDWDPSARCPHYDTWVAQLLPADCAGFLDEVMGYLMYNGNPLHKAILLHGAGRNGKGTWLRFVVAMLGRGNCSAVPLQTLTENRFAAAEVHMKLANVAGDLDSRHVEQTNVFKMVTGQDLIYAERKNQQPFKFVAWAVPLFSANVIPTSSDTSVGYLSRWEVVPFPRSIPDLPGGINPRIEEYIVASELPGIARRGVEGLQRLMQRGGFARPESVRDAFKTFERRVDQVRHWLDERVDTEKKNDNEKFKWWTYRTDLYGDYCRWCFASGHRQMNAGTFYERLENAGYQTERRDNRRGFAGLRLRPDDAPDASSSASSQRLRAVLNDE